MTKPPTMSSCTQEECARYCDDLETSCRAYAYNVGMMEEYELASAARDQAESYKEIARRIRAITSLTPKETK